MRLRRSARRELHRVGQRSRARPRSRATTTALGEQLDRRGIDIDAITRAGRGLRGRGAVLGRRHRRHALRALSRARRAARHLRQARGLRGHPAADARHAHASRCISPGTRPTTTARCASRRPALGLGFDAMNSNTFSGPAAARRSPTSSARSPTPTRRCARRRSSTTSNASRSAQTLGSKALTVWIGDGSNFPGQSQLRPRVRALSRIDARDLRRAARRLAHVHRAQDVRAGLLFDGDAGLGHQLPDGGAGAGPEGLLPGRPRPPRAERQHRDDRRAADPVRQARRLPLQRFANTATTISTPARSIRSGCSWCSTSWSTPSSRGAPGFDPAYMLDQSHNVTDPIESLMVSGDRGAARLCAGAAGRPRRRSTGYQDANDALMARGPSGGLPHRRRADPRRGAPAPGRRHRSGRRLPRQRLPRPQGRGAAAAGELGGGIV